MNFSLHDGLRLGLINKFMCQHNRIGSPNTIYGKTFAGKNFRILSGKYLAICGETFAVAFL